MSNPNFHELVDDVFLSIEDSIEDSDIDIDYENANGNKFNEITTTKSTPTNTINEWK